MNRYLSSITLISLLLSMCGDAQESLVVAKAGNDKLTADDVQCSRSLADYRTRLEKVPYEEACHQLEQKEVNRFLRRHLQDAAERKLRLNIRQTDDVVPVNHDEIINQTLVIFRAARKVMSGASADKVYEDDVRRLNVSREYFDSALAHFSTPQSVDQAMENLKEKSVATMRQRARQAAVSQAIRQWIQEEAEETGKPSEAITVELIQELLNAENVYVAERFEIRSWSDILLLTD